MSSNHMLSIGEYEVNRVTPAEAREPYRALLDTSRIEGLHRICDNAHAKVFYTLAHVEALLERLDELGMTMKQDVYGLYADGENWILDVRSPLAMLCWYKSNDEYADALAYRKQRMLGGSEFDSVYQHLMRHENVIKNPAVT